MDDVSFEISIPADNDGYCFLRCPTCGEFFKVKPDDYEDEGSLGIRCPACGINGKNYMTEDVTDFAMTIAQNYAAEMLYNELKKMEKQFKGKFVTFKVGKKPKPEPETPIRAGIEALAITYFPCCKRSAKIKPLLQITGCYCPFCGVKNYDVE